MEKVNVYTNSIFLFFILFSMQIKQQQLRFLHKFINSFIQNPIDTNNPNKIIPIKIIDIQNNNINAIIRDMSWSIIIFNKYILI